MKKGRKVCVVLTVMMVGITAGCGAKTGTPKETGNGVQSVQNKDQAQKNNPENQVVGKVLEIVGNELTIQVGTLNRANMQGDQNGQPGEGGNKSEGVERPQGVSKPEGVERPEGANRSEGMERPTGANKPEGVERPQGMGAMKGLEGSNMEEMVELSEETKSFIIPVSVPVQMYGEEMTFSQIAKDQYLIIQQNDNGDVIAISMLE